MIKNSKQRQIVLNVLRELDNHPTAGEVWEIAKKQMPNISLGTVYRDLHQLARERLIVSFIQEGQPERFDGTCGRHFHFVCDRCGKVSDLFGKELLVQCDTMSVLASEECGGQLRADSLVFGGLCAECGKNIGKII